MNFTTILGMIAGIGIVVIAIVATAENALVFLNFPGLLIVLGGTIAATIVSFPPRYLLRVWRNFLYALKNERVYDKQDVEEIANIARLWKAAKIQKIEEAIDDIKSPFLRTGLQLVVDGAPFDDIATLLEWRIERLKAREYAEANVFRTMGSYAPAFGMVGTLLGLVNMLYTMSGGSFAEVGFNMAVALITTFYGIVLANLFFKPIAAKLEDRTNQRVHTLSMVIEAVNLISERRSPAYIRETLYSFLAEYDDELNEDIPDHDMESNDG